MKIIYQCCFTLNLDKELAVYLERVGFRFSSLYSAKLPAKSILGKYLTLVEIMAKGGTRKVQSCHRIFGTLGFLNTEVLLCLGPYKGHV